MGKEGRMAAASPPVVARRTKAVADGAAVSPEGRACRKGAYGVTPPFSGGRLAPPRSVLT